MSRRVQWGIEYTGYTIHSICPMLANAVEMQTGAIVL
jgi:hypothetical protein